MLESLITSKTRIKLLIRLFLNPSTFGYLRGLADEFKESTNSVRIELNRLEDAGMLNAKSEGNKKLYQANINHPLFSDIQNILKKVTGIDEIINSIIKNIGGLKQVYLTGDLAQGKDVSIIELIVVGENIDQSYMDKIVMKSEKLLNRSISIEQISAKNISQINKIKTQNNVILWSDEET